MTDHIRSDYAMRNDRLTEKQASTASRRVWRAVGIVFLALLAVIVVAIVKGGR